MFSYTGVLWTCIVKLCSGLVCPYVFFWWFSRRDCSPGLSAHAHSVNILKLKCVLSPQPHTQCQPSTALKWKLGKNLSGTRLLYSGTPGSSCVREHESYVCFLWPCASGRILFSYHGDRKNKHCLVCVLHRHIMRMVVLAPIMVWVQVFKTFGGRMNPAVGIRLTPG